MKISLGQVLSGALVALLPLLAAADHVVPVDEVTSYVKIRKTPDAGAEIVGRLHRSKPRPHVATVEGWHEVELDDGSSGFVSSDWSVIIAETEPETQTVTETETATATAAEAEPAEESQEEAAESIVQEAGVSGEIRIGCRVIQSLTSMINFLVVLVGIA